MKPSKPKKWKWQLSEQMKKAIEMNNTCDENLEKELRELQLKKDAVEDEHKKRQENFINSQKKVKAGRSKSKKDYSGKNARGSQPDVGVRTKIHLRWLSEDGGINDQQQTEATLTPRRRRQSLPVNMLVERQILPVNMSVEQSNPSVRPTVLQRDGLPVNHRNNRLFNKTGVSLGMPNALHHRRHSLQPIENALKPLCNVDKYACSSDTQILRPFLCEEFLSRPIHDRMIEQKSSHETTINYADSRSCLEDRRVSLQEHFKLPALKSGTETRKKTDTKVKETKNVDKIHLCHELQNAAEPKAGRRRQTVHDLIAPLERVDSGKILNLPEDKYEFGDCAIIPQTQEIKTPNLSKLRRISLPMMHLDQHRASNGTELKTGRENLLIEQEIERLKINDRCRKNSRIFSFIED